LADNINNDKFLTFSLAIQEITYSIPGERILLTKTHVLNITGTEILKSHRQHHLYTTYNMMQVPLVGEEMQKRFDLQIMATFVVAILLDLAHG